jgi:uncharacterized protein
MLIRFVIDNVYSFGEECEFNMLPQPRLRTLDHHKYNVGGLDLVKMGAIYGSNGAGKSNLVKALDLLKSIVMGATVRRLEKAQFKLVKTEKAARQLLAVEFVENDIPFYYGLEVVAGRVTCEELYISGLGKKEDELVFERGIAENGRPTLRFLPDPERDAKNNVFIEVLTESYIKSDLSILGLLAESEKGPTGIKVGNALEWFENTLTLVTPDTKALGLPQFLDLDPNYKEFADAFVSSFDLGISHLQVRRQALQEYLGAHDPEEFDAILENLDSSPRQSIQRHTQDHGPVVVVQEGNQVVAKTLLLTHDRFAGPSQAFEIGEESDGTVRLLDFIPIMKGLANHRRVYIVDEIERSLHPLLIKEIVRKFSMDTTSQGQLIFTTHESNLLDQGILRHDEIWFVEKNELGSTGLHTLSDFKEHNTLDIRKGYLQGRYGGVPYLGKLENLNLHIHAQA